VQTAKEKFMFILGFIGFGEAGFSIAEGLKGDGLDQIIAYDKYWNVEPNSELICGRAEKTQVELVPGMKELIEKSDMIISAVSADMAVELARTASPFLNKDKIYVDINATSPMTKEAVDAIISPVALFVDCAVMGPVPTYRHKVPVSVSGKGARLFTEKMRPFGMNITLMDAPAGSASASKMFRSIFMKGFVVILLEMLEAAHKYRVEDDVLQSVKETLTSGPLLEVINGLLGRGVIHSERREHEMDEVIATLDTIRIDATMSKATKAKLRWCTNLGLKEYFKGIPPKDFHDIFLALDKNETSV
jgi:3-hydroxyisobutyrate dehydrogenase-like beta-hydroxyacid dehydrogenase